MEHLDDTFIQKKNLMQLTDSQKEYLLSTLSKQFPEAEFFVFGSRVRNTSELYSDVDIIIEKKREPSDLQSLALARADLEEGDFPYIVDLVLSYHLDASFAETIQKQRQKLSM